MSWEIVKRCPWGQLGAKPYRLFYSFGGEALKIIELKLNEEQKELFANSVASVQELIDTLDEKFFI